MYEKATDPTLRETYLFALSLFRDPAVFSKAIDYAFSGKVRTQDMPGFIASLMFNPFARVQAWTAVKSHWADLQRDVPTAMRAFTGPLGQFCDAATKKDIQDFFATHSAGTGSRNLQRSLESIDRCIAFRAAQQGSFDRSVAAMK